MNLPNVDKDEVWCIFCRKVKPTSIEHVFPYAIGGRKEIKKVCQDCNSTMGYKIDSKLCNHKLIAIQRWKYKLRGQSGEIPDPILDILGTGTLDQDQNVRVKTRIDSYNNQPVHSFFSESGKSDVIGTKDEILHMIAKRTNRTRKKKALPPLSFENSLLEAANLLGTLPKKYIGPSLEVKYSINFDINSAIPGLLKIAYEIAFCWLGSKYCFDPIALSIASYLRGESKEMPDVNVSFGYEVPLFMGLPEEILAIGQKQSNGLWVTIGLLGTLRFSVRVGDSKRKFCRDSLIAQRGYFYSRNVLTGNVKEYTWDEEMINSKKTNFGHTLSNNVNVSKHNIN